MSFRDVIELTDPRRMRALSHPVRLALLDHLLSVAAATATDCAAAVGESPSSCSYHLRTLAEHGFVEEAESTDGRARPWRLVVRGFDLTADTPEQRVAAEALSDELLRQDDRVLWRYLRSSQAYGEEWRKAAIHARATLHLTPDELTELRRAYLGLLEPYVRREEGGDFPAGAARVRVMFRGVPAEAAGGREG